MPISLIVVLGLCVLALVAAIFWLLRRFGSPSGAQNRSGRQPRLAVIEESTVDSRRKLVLIRRDNIEHLLLIGGPTDVVVEADIVRAQAAQTREVATARGTGATESLPRTVPLNDSAWPLAPEAPAPRPQRQPAADDTLNWSPSAEPGPRRTRPNDMLAGLAAELSAQPEPVAPPHRAASIEPRLTPAPRAAAEPAISPAADQNLAEMAQRLEAALRRPAATAPELRAPEPRQVTPPVAPPSAPPAPPSEPLKRDTGAREQAPAIRAEPKLNGPAEPKADAARESDKNPFSSLEEEMASLLGRQGKT